MAALIAALATGCREDEMVIAAEVTPLPGYTRPAGTDIAGLYVLNEGNMGSNKCTLDYMDLETGVYSRNIYAERNPTVVKELGDVGNDIAVYGGRLYIVVNCSHKVEVLDARTGVRIGQVDIPNCRYIKFDGPRAYVSSYVGPVAIDKDAPRGAVYAVDTASLAVTAQVTVGYQPEEMEIIDGYLYVANSGGYRPPLYDNTVSVVRLSDMRQVRQIAVGINLHRLRRDRRGRLWVTSRGDKNGRASCIYRLSPDGAAGSMKVTDSIAVPCSAIALHGDSLHYVASNITYAGAGGAGNTFGIIDINTCKVLTTQFISDGTDSSITIPYSIAVHPETGDVLITDAKNYVSSGNLLCYSPAGVLRWKARTGDIPSAITFLYR